MKKVVIFLVAIVLLLGASYGLFNISQKDNGRIDIYNAQNAENTIEVLQATPGIVYSDPDDYKSPEWKDEPGQGTTFKFTPDFFWKDAEVVFKAVGDGRLDFTLLGVYRAKNGTDELQEVKVEYKDVTVNDEMLFEGPEALWHNDSRSFSIPATNDEVYTLKFKYRAPLSFLNKKAEVVEEQQGEEEYSEEPQGEEEYTEEQQGEEEYSEEQQGEEEYTEEQTEEQVEEEQPVEEQSEEEQPEEQAE